MTQGYNNLTCFAKTVESAMNPGKIEFTHRTLEHCQLIQTSWYPIQANISIVSSLEGVFHRPRGRNKVPWCLCQVVKGWPKDSSKIRSDLMRIWGTELSIQLASVCVVICMQHKVPNRLLKWQRINWGTCTPICGRKRQVAGKYWG